MRDFDRIRSFILSYGHEEADMLGELYRNAVANDIPVIRPDMKELLRLLLLIKRPKRILEVGTAWGFSALFMSECVPEAKVITIELDPVRAEEARQRIRQMGKEPAAMKEGENAGEYAEKNSGIGAFDDQTGIRRTEEQAGIRVLEGDAAVVLKELSDDPKRFDFVFIDAAKAQYGEYFELIRPMLAPGAVVVSDNVLQDGSILESHFLVEKRDRTIHDRMREYLRFLTETPGLVTSILPVGDGAAVTYIKDGTDPSDRIS